MPLEISKLIFKMSSMDKNSELKNLLTKKEFTSAINPLKDDVKTLKSDVAILKRSVLNIENKINIYSDMYEVNKWNSEKLANRVNKLEKHAGIKPPEEFLVSGL
jgi:polyhydroxyalkanoate synthesis regulator phasin